MSDALSCTFASFPGFLPWALAIGSLMYGVFTTIFAMSMYILLCKGLKSMPSKVVFTTIIVMYAVSMLHWIGISILAQQAPRSTPQSPYLKGFVVTAIDFLPYVNFVLGDAIVVWRAWLVWDRRTLIFLFPGAVFIGGIATLIVYIVTSARRLGHDGLDVFCILHNLQGLPITYMLAVTTNAYATLLVALKAWYVLTPSTLLKLLIVFTAGRRRHHRSSIKRHLGDGNRRTRVERTLILLVESGSIYCAILAVATACIWANAFLAAVFVQLLLVQLTGIYPTIIIVLASYQMTHCDRNFTYETPVAFASPSRASRDAATFDLASAISITGPRRPSADDHSQTPAENVVIAVDQEWKSDHDIAYTTPRT